MVKNKHQQGNTIKFKTNRKNKVENCLERLSRIVLKMEKILIAILKF